MIRRFRKWLWEWLNKPKTTPQSPVVVPLQPTSLLARMRRVRQRLQEKPPKPSPYEEAAVELEQLAKWVQKHELKDRTGTVPQWHVITARLAAVSKRLRGMKP